MMNWYALVPVERYYTTPTNGFDSNNNLYNNNNIGSSDGRSSSSNTGGRRMTTIVAKLGESRNATIIDDVGVQPSGHVTLPTYTRDMAREAIRPAPWVCGSNDDYSTDRSDDEHEIQSSVPSSIEGERHIFSFVHVYKSAGSTIRTFFRQYAEICHKSWMLLVSCKDHRNPSTHHSSSISIRALEAGNGEETYWKGCKIKEIYIRPDDLINDNSMLNEDSIDIYGGHFRIGIAGNDNETAFGNNGDDTGSNYSAGQHSSIRQQSPRPSSSSTAVVVRHIVFLRDPMARFVSGILYQHQRSAQFDGTLDGAVQRIKKNVRGSRKKQEYWIRSLNYLLTQSQASNFAMTRKIIMDGSNITTLEEKMNSMAEIESRTAIQNLVQYNVIVGMVERMDQSMVILRHVLSHTDVNTLPRGSAAVDATDAASTTTTASQEGQDEIGSLFNGFGGSSSKSEVALRGGDVVQESLKENIRMNASGQEGVTTELVLEELKKDTTFMPLFVEYVKYEQRIHDYAWVMHKMQYKEAGVR
jgi:hypothetical protein